MSIIVRRPSLALKLGWLGQLEFPYESVWTSGRSLEVRQHPGSQNPEETEKVFMGSRRWFEAPVCSIWLTGHVKLPVYLHREGPQLKVWEMVQNHQWRQKSPVWPSSDLHQELWVFKKVMGFFHCGAMLLKNKTRNGSDYQRLKDRDSGSGALTLKDQTQWHSVLWCHFLYGGG